MDKHCKAMSRMLYKLCLESGPSERINPCIDLKKCFNYKILLLVSPFSLYNFVSYRFLQGLKYLQALAYINILIPNKGMRIGHRPLPLNNYHDPIQKNITKTL